MVTVSCSGKLHAFALAEQLEQNRQLTSFYTTYAYQKNTFFSKFVKRIDKENIPINKIHTNIPLAFPIKLMNDKVHIWNNMYDKWVASKITNSKSKIFIGWSGMSLHSIRTAKKIGMSTIVERGSSHILFQDKILKEEYKKFGIDFSVHPVVIEKELKEYEEADYISVPSYFVKNSFIEYGVNENKIFMNPYGAGSFFKPNENSTISKKFTILYLGSLSVRKGLVYLFEALNSLQMPEESYEILFLGKVDEILKPTIDKLKKKNWKFMGHVNFYELQPILAGCDVAVHPSLEEGLSMGIPQMMSCGVPVIATTNTGGENIIKNEENGFIVPIRDSEIIKDKLTYLYNNKEVLELMKNKAVESVIKGFTWDDYGNRYAEFINKIGN